MAKKNKGITLIALIITIVVMLILVAVSVNVLIKSNLIGTAEKAAKKQTDATIFEEVKVAYSGAYTGQYLENTPLAKIMERELRKQDSTAEVLGDKENLLIKYKERELVLKNGEITDETVATKVTDTTPGVLAGEGTAESPYLIQSIEDLVAFSNNVNNGTTYEGKYVNLELTLDFKSENSYVDPSNMNGLTTGSGFTPIGGKGVKFAYSGTTATAFGAGEFIANFFKGTFDGKGNYIKNLYINGESDESNTEGYTVGLFGANAGTIKNLNVTGNITGTMSHSKNFAETSFGVGGIVGLNNTGGKIENCSNYAEIKAVINNASCHAGVSGIVAGNWYAEISNCKNYGNVTLEGESSNGFACGLGGIAGGTYGTSNVTNCSNYGTISNEGSKYMGATGGLIGASSGNMNDADVNKVNLTIENCNNYGVVKTGKLTSNGEVPGEMFSIAQLVGIFGYAQGSNYLKNCNNSYDSVIDCEKEVPMLLGVIMIFNEKIIVENLKTEGTITFNNATNVTFVTNILGSLSETKGAITIKNCESNLNININAKSGEKLTVSGYTDAPLNGTKYNGKIQITADKTTSAQGEDGVNAEIKIAGENDAYILNGEQKNGSDRDPNMQM